MIDPICPDYRNTPVSSQRPIYDYSPATSVIPYVSIVTPFYNTGTVFHETAESILRQSFQQWEWLIINDNSTDPESLSVLETYRHRDQRIRVIDYKENRGISAARNSGFQMAQTNYLVQIDSDDLLETTAVEKWLWFLLSYPEYGFVKGFSVGFGAKEYLWDKGFHWGSAFLDENLVDPPAMLHREVHHSVGGYDETNREGLEDWDFWLHCADKGFWGGTIPEYLNWYRCRPSHTDRWLNFQKERFRGFRKVLQQRYPSLWKGKFPQIQVQQQVSYATLPTDLPGPNLLRKSKSRLLMLLPWMTVGGSDKFNLDLLSRLALKGWEVSIATTMRGDQSWYPEFTRFTSDVFILDHFLRLVDYPRFLYYLIQSRQIDTVFISNCELGYLLLPYLRSNFPGVTFVDYCHIEEENWKNGGHPRAAVEYQELLDLNIVSSEHLKQWMIQRGAKAERIEVCHTNIDTDQWKPDPVGRSSIRVELGITAEKPIVLYVARLNAQKQPLVFAHTMELLHREGLEFIALVAGDGSELGALRRYIHSRRLQKHIRLLGTVSNLRIRQLMAASDIFFLPSQWEGIALSLYEAMSCALPVVSASVGGQQELVTPNCGILIPRTDVETEAISYAAALAKLLRDSGERQVMGLAGRERVSKGFRLDRMGERINILLGLAQQYHAQKPHPLLSAALGRACSIQAIEYTRLSTPPHYPLKGLYHTKGELSRGESLYLALRKIFLPVYNEIQGVGGTQVVALKDKIKTLLLK